MAEKWWEGLEDDETTDAEEREKVKALANCLGRCSGNRVEHEAFLTQDMPIIEARAARTAGPGASKRELWLAVRETALSFWNHRVRTGNYSGENKAERQNAEIKAQLELRYGSNHDVGGVDGPTADSRVRPSALRALPRTSND